MKWIKLCTTWTCALFSATAALNATSTYYVCYEEKTYLKICDSSYDAESSYTWSVADNSIVEKTSEGECWVELEGASPGKTTVKAFKNGSECGTFDVTCVRIKPEAVATSPNQRIRTKLGVGESVNLSLLPDSLQLPSWSLEQGSSSLTPAYRKALLVGHHFAEKAKVKASFTGGYCELELDIIEPSGVTLEFDSRVGSGTNPLYLTYKANIYVTPADVKFVNLSVAEKTARAISTGYFSYQNGKGHKPSQYDFLDSHVQGKGTKCIAKDTIAGTTEGGTAPAYSNGDFKWSIPWVWKSSDGGGSDRTLATLEHIKELSQVNSKWTLSLNKAGTSDSISLP